MKIIIWGIGKHCDDRLYCYPQILDDTICFIDSNITKQSETYFGKKIVGPEELKNIEFDLILLGLVRGYQEVFNICVTKYAVPDEKIKTIDEYITGKLLTNEFRVGEVCIDASTMCQLDCVQCYMRKSNYGNVGCGYLTFANFKKFIESNPYVKSIELANSGEVFLNPELAEIIEYAYENEIRLTAWDGVNFNDVSEKVLELLVQKNFREITIALDGASQESYVKYRRKGDFNKVISNIRKLNEFKKKYNSEYPKLNWQYIIMPSTENDIEQAKELAAELNMTIKFRLTWDETYKPTDPEKIKRSTGLQFVTRKEFDDKNKKKCMTGCLQLFTRPQINWDGVLMGCKCIYMSNFKYNVFETSLEEVLAKPEVISAKELVKGKVENLTDEYDYPCKHCKYMMQMKKNESYICTEKFF